MGQVKADGLKEFRKWADNNAQVKYWLSFPVTIMATESDTHRFLQCRECGKRLRKGSLAYQELVIESDPRPGWHGKMLVEAAPWVVCVSCYESEKKG